MTHVTGAQRFLTGCSSARSAWIARFDAAAGAGGFFARGGRRRGRLWVVCPGPHFRPESARMLPPRGEFFLAEGGRAQAATPIELFEPGHQPSQNAGRRCDGHGEGVAWWLTGVVLIHDHTDHRRKRDD